jgi:hypothetical protein
VLAAAACLLRAGLVREERLPWLIVGAGLALAGVAGVIYLFRPAKDCYQRHPPRRALATSVLDAVLASGKGLEPAATPA